MIFYHFSLYRIHFSCVCCGVLISEVYHFCPDLKSLSTFAPICRVQTEFAFKLLSGSEAYMHALKPVRTPVAILGSLGVCIYVPASRHWLISYSPIHLT